MWRYCCKFTHLGPGGEMLFTYAVKWAQTLFIWVVEFVSSLHLKSYHMASLVPAEPHDHIFDSMDHRSSCSFISTRSLDRMGCLAEVKPIMCRGLQVYKSQDVQRRIRGGACRPLFVMPLITYATRNRRMHFHLNPMNSWMRQLSLAEYLSSKMLLVRWCSLSLHTALNSPIHQWKYGIWKR